MNVSEVVRIIMDAHQDGDQREQSYQQASFEGMPQVLFSLTYV
jgi:hypothetical protein